MSRQSDDRPVFPIKRAHSSDSPHVPLLREHEWLVSLDDPFIDKRANRAIGRTLGHTAHLGELLDAAGEMSVLVIRVFGKGGERPRTTHPLIGADMLKVE